MILNNGYNFSFRLYINQLCSLLAPSTHCSTFFNYVMKISISDSIDHTLLSHILLQIYRMPMPSILTLLILTTLLCMAQSQSQNSKQARPGSDLVKDGGLLGPGSFRFSTSVEDSESLRPKFKLFRSSIDIDDEVEEGKSNTDSLSRTVNQEPAVEEEEDDDDDNDDDVKSKQSFKLFRFVIDDEDESQDFLSKNIKPAVITESPSTSMNLDLKSVIVTSPNVNDDGPIVIFGPGAEDSKETLPVGTTELESSSVFSLLLPALDEYEVDEMIELESNDGTNKSLEDEDCTEDSVEEETESLLTLSGMMKFVTSLMSSNEVKEETETSSEGEKTLSKPTFKSAINANPSTSSVEVDPQIESSQESSFLLNDGAQILEEYQDNEQNEEINQDPLPIIGSAQTDGDSTSDDLMEKEVDKMMEDMLTGSSNSQDDVESGSSEIVGRDQLGSKFKPLVIKVLGSFKSSNLTLNGKVEKLRRVLIAESPAIIR